MAYPLVCLATDRTFNFSKFIFNNMKGNVKSSYKFLMYPRFVQAVLNEFQLLPHKRIYEPSTLKPKVFQNMSKASELWNGEVHPLFPQILAKISQVQGEDAPIPVASQNTPTKLPTSLISTLHVAEPFGLGTSSGGSRLNPSPTREEPESMPHDSPLPAGYTVGSDEGSVQQNELMDICTNLVKQVQALEKDLAQTKEQHATELNTLKAEIQRLQIEVKNLKKQRSQVVSSSSSPSDEFSASSTKFLGDSSKQGRKIDAELKGRSKNFDKDFAELNDSDNAQAKDDVAETEGRKLDFEDMDADAGFNFDDLVGTAQPISTEAEQVPTDQSFPTAREKVTTATQEVTTAEEEAARIRSVKGKAIVIASDQKTRKISKYEQAQIDFDARLAEQQQAEEYERKKKLKEDEVASFMEATRLDKLEAVMAQPLSAVSPMIMHEKPPLFTYVPTEDEIDYLVNNDQIIRKKAIELIANTTLNEEQRSAQLKDFIQMKNQQALDEIIGDVRKGQ